MGYNVLTFRPWGIFAVNIAKIVMPASMACEHLGSLKFLDERPTIILNTYHLQQ